MRRTASGDQKESMPGGVDLGQGGKDSEFQPLALLQEQGLEALNFTVPPSPTVDPLTPPPDRPESTYFSMRDSIPFRSHSGSVDNLDIIEVVRRSQDTHGESLPDDRREDDVEDDSSEGEAILGGGGPTEDDDILEDIRDDCRVMSVAGVAGSGSAAGSGTAGAGGAGDAGVGDSGKNLERAIQPPGDGPDSGAGGLKGNNSGAALNTSSFFTETGSTSLASSLSVSSAYEAIAADRGARRGSSSPRITVHGSSDTVFRDSNTPNLQPIRAGYDGGSRQNGRGVRNPGGRERSSTTVSSSSDESMSGYARLSGDAMKKQWEEAMNGATNPETPLRSHRPSASAEASGSSSRTGGSMIFSPSGRTIPMAMFGSWDGAGAVSSRRERAGSVGGGGGASAESVLGTHLRTYGWVPDEDVAECMNACGAEFTHWERRHHCRCCGGIFCHDCSRHRCLVPDPVAPPLPGHLDPTRPHRVCNACYADVQSSQEELLATVSNARRHNAFNSDSRERYCNPPFGWDLAHEVRKSANSLNNVLSRRIGCDGLSDMAIGEQKLAQVLLHSARGLVFVTVAKAGFIYAAEAGTGLCVARLANGDWSAPAAVCTFGVSWGFQAGCQVVDMVIPLRSDAAVETLKSGGQVYVEVDVALAVGPLGRLVGTSVNGRTWPGEHVSVDVGARYSLSKGLFAGVGFGAGFLRVMDRVNERFYGAQVTPRSLLSGVMPRPTAANPLYTSLNRLDCASGK